MRANSKGVGGHQRPHRGKSDTYLTPPEIIKTLGPFDLDPCCPPDMPWRTATMMIAPPGDGLAAEWTGRVWLNPPYGPETSKWLEKLSLHGDGIALAFARTETKFFHDFVWAKATALLFLRGRIHFHDAAGVRLKFNAGAPSVLVAYGIHCAIRLRLADLAGQFIVL